LPGEFRRSQNWIGGRTISEASFVPPHESEIPDLMSDLEKFWHNNKINVPHLIRIGLSHYQFETIHPFLDGNGRIGRLLIPLYLVNFDILDSPSLYLSDYFEKNRLAYYEALNRVKVTNDIIHWIKFFLTAVDETSKIGINTFEKILKFKEEVENRILKLNRKAEKAKILLNFLYRKPNININEVCELLNLTPRPVNELLTALEKVNILKEVTGFKRNRIYSFHQYIRIFTT
jgi:Fic family protein